MLRRFLQRWIPNRGRPAKKLGRTRSRLAVESLEGRLLLDAAPFFHLDPQKYEPSEIIVRFQPGVTPNGDAILPGSAIGKEFAPLLVPGLRLVQLPASVTVEDALRVFEQSSAVAYAVPNYVIQAAVLPNDPEFFNQWGLHNTGQFGGVVDADVDAPEAWDIHHGTGNTIVAIIDTGIDYNHPDLAANIWINTGEIPGNSIDDDGNGYVDDTRGWDFANNDNNPIDDNGHGTHVAGIAGAVGNNGIGVTGVNWNVKLMAVKYLNAGGSGDGVGAIAALNYAVANGARVSNNSYGSFGADAYYQPMFDALAAARNAGHLFVAAAGNNGQDTDITPMYPANYALDNVISVGASDYNDNLTPFSNRGRTSVDLVAPGYQVRSTLPGGSYGYATGTSMSSPHVAGAAALLWDLHPTWTYQQVRDELFGTVDVLPQFQNVTVTGGRLNVGRVLFASVNLPMVTITATDPDAAEAGGDTGTFTVSRIIGPTTAALVVNYTIGGVAANGTDYAALSGSVTIPAGATSTTITVNPINDSTAEGSETVTLTLSSNAAYTIGTPASATVVITDDDGSVLVSIWNSSATPAGFQADPQPVELGLKFRSDVSGQVAGVRYYKGSANTGPHTGSLWDSSGNLLATATFTGETTSGWQQVLFSTPVTIAANTIYTVSYHTNGNYGLDTSYFTSGLDSGVLHAPSSGSVGGNGVYRFGASAFPSSSYSASNYWVDVLFNPSGGGGMLPSVTVAATDANASEPGSDTGTFTVTRGGSTTAALVVNYTVSGTATSGADYTSLPGTVTIPAGSTSTTITVSPIDDATYEGNETVILTLAAGSYAIGAPGSGTVTIADNEVPPPTVTITATDANAAEAGADPGTFTLTRTGSTAAALMVNLTISGTATNGSDYTTLATSVTIPASSASTTITVSPIDDTTAEGNETVILTLANGGGAYLIGAPSNATVTIADDDGPTLLSLWSSTTTPSSFLPGSQPFELGLKFRADVAGSITGVRFYKAAGETGPHTGSLWDSSGNLLATVTFTGETASGWQQMLFGSPVVIAGNTTYVISYHSNGYFGYNSSYFASSGVDNDVLHAPSSPAAGGNGVYLAGASGFPSSTYSATNYWVDVVFSTSTLPTVTIAATDPNASESGSDTGTFTVTRAGSTTAALVVNYSTSGTAASGADYTALPGSVTILAGSTTATITVTPIDDTTAEASETVVLTLSANASYAVGSPSSATVTIADDDGPPTVAIVATDPNASEPGSDTGTFTVTRSGPTTSALVVNFTITGSATNGSDYTSISASATIAAGSASAAITVSPIDDTANEGSETVILTLASGTYTIGTPASATVTIADNDAPAVASIWSSSVTPASSLPGSQPFELGLKFRADVAGSIAGVRFYKVAGDPGPHTGSLWTNGGTLLATVTFTGETASGWQQMLFSSAVAITANTTYVISYHTNGYFGYDLNYFASTGVDNGVLHALSSPASGGNGVYNLGGSAFPTSTYNATNYWVDIVFSTGSGQAASTALAATVIDNGQPGYSEVGSWLSGELIYKGSSRSADPGSGATDAGYRTSDGDKLLRTVLVDQRVEPSGLVVDVRPLQALATVKVESGALRLELPATDLGRIVTL